jgi:hypothetical protein
MPQVTLDIPEENMPLFMHITEAMGITKENLLIKDESPDWHLQILNDRLERYNSGKTTAGSWDDFEKELDSDHEEE